jgi:PAS domain S-box-containing protein
VSDVTDIDKAKAAVPRKSKATKPAIKVTPPEVPASEPIPKKRGRRPKAEASGQGNLYNPILAQKLEEKIRDLEEQITGRSKVEKELRQSEERYRLLFETMAQGVICIDKDARIISANDAVARIWGLPVDRLTGMTISDPRLKVIHEDGTDYAVDSLPALEAMRTGKPEKERVLGIFNYADETYHWVSGSAVPMFRSGEDMPYLVPAHTPGRTQGSSGPWPSGG